VQANAAILRREQGMAQMSPPRALETAEVEALLDGFEQSVRNAKAAGFDGVELHAASGYLPHQFLGSGTNLREDRFGGTPEKRCRLVLDVLARFIAVYGASRVGIKLAPKITYNDMQDNEADVTFDILVRELDRLGLAYLVFRRRFPMTRLLPPICISAAAASSILPMFFPTPSCANGSTARDGGRRSDLRYCQPGAGGRPGGSVRLWSRLCQQPGSRGALCSKCGTGRTLHDDPLLRRRGGIYGLSRHWLNACKKGGARQ
jgi:hypothetical protein